MRTRAEIEEYLKGKGVEIQSSDKEFKTTDYGEDVVYTARYMPFTGEKIVESNEKIRRTKEINEDAKKALLDLISESVTNGDMETAKVALEVLQDSSSYYKSNKNAAFRPSIPLDKRMEFEEYYNKQNPPKKEYTGPGAAFMAANDEAKADDFASKLRSEVKTTEEMAAEIGTDDDNEVKSKVVETQDRSEI